MKDTNAAENESSEQQKIRSSGEQRRLDEICSAANPRQCVRMIIETAANFREEAVLCRILHDLPVSLAKRIIDTDTSLQTLFSSVVQSEVAQMVTKSRSIVRDKKKALEFVKSDGTNLDLLEESWKSDFDVVLAAVSQNPESYLFVSHNLQSNFYVLRELYTHLSLEKREEIQQILDGGDKKSCTVFAQRLFSDFKRGEDVASWVFFVHHLPPRLAAEMVFEHHEWFPYFSIQLRSDYHVALYSITSDGRNYAYVATDELLEMLLPHALAAFKIKKPVGQQAFCENFFAIPDAVRNNIPDRLKALAEQFFERLSTELNESKGDLRQASAKLSDTVLSLFPIAHEVIRDIYLPKELRDRVFEIEEVLNDPILIRARASCHSV
jgi:hypothetical protein